MPCKACNDSGSIRCYVAIDAASRPDVDEKIGDVPAFDYLVFQCPSCLVGDDRWPEAKVILADMTEKVGAKAPYVLASVWTEIAERESHRRFPRSYDRAAG